MFSSSAPGAPSLLLDDVWLDHDGVDALCGVSVAVPPGALTVVAGPNGSGKSTLLAVLAGLLVPRRGSVSLPRPASTAFVVQRSDVPDRLPLTVHDAVAMGRWARAGLFGRLRAGDRRIVEESIAAVGLTGFEGRPLWALSGGQRQRAFLAQGLAQRADLLLLDEPTTGLDAGTRDVVVGLLALEKARGATVVCVSHDAAVLEVADRTIRLDEGRVLVGDSRAGPHHTF
ncbi:zinc ABC transporter ATP-binding protein AztA [Arthrobacter agilis]|uniref:zinc ABC transporter ATP-binding protein AztA n=1 Tax=Arthrobacter agilis TaxID=37921 RepID=UPI0023656CA0|nr:zinc ABC transporter ATP-binding protein AztA [Arthrobacter agilis]WDF33282.1 zinc ABC transporter ATP-binding protein AztA [Arthrobacter agilis]